MTNSEGKGKGKGKAASRAARKNKVPIDHNKVDMISELPDDILISILSRLSVQDATATSILSTRWRHLCTYITRLHFQPLQLRKRISASTPPKEKNNFHPLTGSSIVSQEMQEEFSTCVHWINHVLDCYNGVLKEFRLRMPFATQVDVEKWLEFAMSREVETLDIQLDRDPSLGYLTGEFRWKKFRACWCYKCRKTGNYTMKNGGYGWSLEDYHEYPIQNLILRNNGCLCFTSLKILYLDNVNLHAIELELLISNCVVLETLSISHSRALENVVTIRGPSLKLKHLKIRNCSSTIIQIHDLINLVSFSFTYSGWEKFLTMDERSSMVVENVPMLTEIDCYHTSHVELLSTVLSCCLHQLLKLTLQIKPATIQNYGWRYSLPKLMNLKHLVLNLDMMFESCLLTLAPFVEASPLLEKLDIVFSWWTPNLINTEPFGERLWEHPHNNLKQVKFFNYLGSPYEFEFALYILKNALNLEEFVVETCAAINAPCYEYDMEAFRREASALAHQQFQATFSRWTPNFINTEPFGKRLWEHPHNNLKQVRFFDYLGSPYEFEFVLYILKNALNLEEFVVETCAAINAPCYEYDTEAFRREASASRTPTISSNGTKIS